MKQKSSFMYVISIIGTATNGFAAFMGIYNGDYGLALINAIGFCICFNGYLGLRHQ